MAELLVPLLFWLSIPASLILSIIGILKDKFWLILIGAVLFFPISYYFNGSPSSHGFGLFQAISAAAVWKGNKFWAWLFLMPALLVVIWFVAVILFYQFSQM